MKKGDIYFQCDMGDNIDIAKKVVEKFIEIYKFKPKVKKDKIYYSRQSCVDGIYTGFYYCIQGTYLVIQVWYDGLFGRKSIMAKAKSLKAYRINLQLLEDTLAGLQGKNLVGYETEILGRYANDQYKLYQQTEGVNEEYWMKEYEIVFWLYNVIFIIYTVLKFIDKDNYDYYGWVLFSFYMNYSCRTLHTRKHKKAVIGIVVASLWIIISIAFFAWEIIKYRI